MLKKILLSIIVSLLSLASVLYTVITYFTGDPLRNEYIDSQYHNHYTIINITDIGNQQLDFENKTMLSSKSYTSEHCACIMDSVAFKSDTLLFYIDSILLDLHENSRYKNGAYINLSDTSVVWNNFEADDFANKLKLKVLSYINGMNSIVYTIDSANFDSTLVHLKLPEHDQFLWEQNHFLKEQVITARVHLTLLKSDLLKTENSILNCIITNGNCTNSTY